LHLAGKHETERVDKNQQGSAPIQRQLAALPVVGGEKRREFEAEDLSANLVFQLGLVE
jgi:hypothetical protein